MKIGRERKGREGGNEEGGRDGEKEEREGGMEINIQP